MNILIYQVLHLAGIMALFTALGAVAAAEQPGLKKLGTALHGIALVLLLVSGFGMLAKLSLGFPGWIIAKLVIWLVMGGMLVVAKRRLLPTPTVFAIILALGVLAAILGVYKGSLGLG